MILNEHYTEVDGALMPQEFYQTLKKFPKTAVTFFSKKLLKLFVKKYECEKIAELENETMVFPIYKTKVKNCNLIVYQSPVGAPAAASLMEDVIALGARHFLAVGCCGCLDESIEATDLIVPNVAIRDEGLSYHYLKTQDEIVLNKKMVALVIESLKKQKQHYVVGKTWTNDGLYRETKEKVAKRKKQGAIVVEMETSALASVAEFRDVHFAQILYGADSLANGGYDKRTFRGEKVPKRVEGIIDVALVCGAHIDRSMNKKEDNQDENPKPPKFFKLLWLLKNEIKRELKASRERKELRRQRKLAKEKAEAEAEKEELKTSSE